MSERDAPFRPQTNTPVGSPNPGVNLGATYFAESQSLAPQLHPKISEIATILVAAESLIHRVDLSPGARDSYLTSKIVEITAAAAGEKTLIINLEKVEKPTDELKEALTVASVISKRPVILYGASEAVKNALSMLKMSGLFVILDGHLDDQSVEWGSPQIFSPGLCDQLNGLLNATPQKQYEKSPVAESREETFEAQRLGTDLVIKLKHENASHSISNHLCEDLQKIANDFKGFIRLVIDLSNVRSLKEEVVEELLSLKKTLVSQSPEKTIRLENTYNLDKKMQWLPSLFNI